MKIYSLNSIWRGFIEKKVLDKETEHSFFYLDKNGKECSMRKRSMSEKWFKSKEEVCLNKVTELKAVIEEKEGFLKDAKKTLADFVSNYAFYLPN